MEKYVTEVTKAASQALGAVYMKCLYAGGMSYKEDTKLIEKVVEPVLFYCSGIWGTHKFPKVQRVQIFSQGSKNDQTLLPRVIWAGYLLK